MAHFNTPIELFVFWDNRYSDYTSLSGQTACKKQAWSAASLLVDTIMLAKQNQSTLAKLQMMISLTKLFNDVKLLQVRSTVQTQIEKIAQKINRVSFRK